VSRANAHVTYPSRFLLVAAANPCRCGYLSEADRACSRAPVCGEDYMAKISGPLMDRFDLRLEVPPVALQDMELPPSGPTSAEVALRVSKARQVQKNRYKDAPDVQTNADASGDLLSEVAELGPDCKSLLLRAGTKFGLSARGYHRVLRVARTIADLAGSDRVEQLHLAEAIGFRLVPPRKRR
jgi:magnesium chelatase family protein